MTTRTPAALEGVGKKYQPYGLLLPKTANLVCVSGIKLVYEALSINFRI